VRDPLHAPRDFIDKTSESVDAASDLSVKPRSLDVETHAERTLVQGEPSPFARCCICREVLTFTRRLPTIFKK
jgi:hypothetical protein